MKKQKEVQGYQSIIKEMKESMDFVDQKLDKEIQQRSELFKKIAEAQNGYISFF